MLSLSRRDLHALRHMLNPVEIPEEVFGFHAQQSVEKAFKAWLSLRGVDYPFEHDLKLLYQLLEDLNETAIERFKDLIELSDFAVQFRYQFFDDEPLDREGTLRSVTGLTALVEKLINGGEADS